MDEVGWALGRRANYKIHVTYLQKEKEQKVNVGRAMELFK